MRWSIHQRPLKRQLVPDRPLVSDDGGAGCGHTNSIAATMLLIELTLRLFVALPGGWPDP